MEVDGPSDYWKYLYGYVLKSLELSSCQGDFNPCHVALQKALPYHYGGDYSQSKTTDLSWSYSLAVFLIVDFFLGRDRNFRELSDALSS